MSAETTFNALRALKREETGDPAVGLTQEEVAAFNAIIAAWSRPSDPLTARVAMEIISHEAIVLEAYRDSVNVWTWGIGVTTASGHDVDRYKDNPQSIRRCLEVFIWLLREKYIPPVLAAFAGFPLSEEQFAAALSFHYNTGAIGRADWVKHVKSGRADLGEAAIMNWRKPPEIIPRRAKERDLFFHGRWTSDGTATVYPVKKPGYRPDFGRARRINIMDDLKAMLA